MMDEVRVNSSRDAVWYVCEALITEILLYGTVQRHQLPVIPSYHHSPNMMNRL